MSLVIRKALMDDLDKVEKLYDDVLDYEAANVSYTNWQKGLYPTRSYGETAINLGTMYLGIENDEIVGSVILNHIQPPEYGKIDWSYEAQGEEVLVIHTLCITPKFTRRGFGREFVDFSEQLAREKGCKTVRLDTYEGNIPATNLYIGMGYRYAGSVMFHFQNVIWETLKCFEKLIS